MALDNFTAEHPSRTSTGQSFDIRTHWQGPCRGCHHHHRPRGINIHISHERNIRKQDFHCENCQKLLFCLGPSETRFSLLSLNTDPGEDADPSQAPSSSRRACFDTPPDNIVSFDPRNQIVRSTDRSSSRSVHVGDTSDSNRASHPDLQTENSEETTQGGTAVETVQVTATQSLPAAGALQHDSRFHVFRALRGRLLGRVSQPWQRFRRWRLSRRPAYPNHPTSPHSDSSTNSDRTLSQPAIPNTESMSALDDGTQRELPAAPVLSSSDQPLPYSSDDQNIPNNDQARINQDGRSTDLNDIVEQEKISKIRDEKTASAKSQGIVCRCSPNCDCRRHTHSRFRSEDHSEQSTSVRPGSSRPSLSESNPEQRLQDPRALGYMGQWFASQEPTERQLELQSTALARRQSMVTVSSATTAAMSHDPLELPDPPPRSPSPLVNPPQTYPLLHMPPQSVGSRSQLRLSTHNLAPIGLETVGEASSTSETSQNQQNAFDVNQQNPQQINEGPTNEGSGESEVHQHEITNQNQSSILPPDNSEHDPNPESSPGSGLQHAQTF